MSIAGLEVGDIFHKECSALLPQLDDFWFLLVLLAVVTLILGVCFLLPTGGVSSALCGEARDCTRLVGEAA